MRRPLSLVAGVLLLAVAIPCSAAAAVPKGFLGVLVDGPVASDPALLAKQAPAMKASGVESMRVVFSWAAAEPAGPPSAEHPTDFGPTDAIVRAAATAGLDVLPVVQVVPDWAAWTPGPFTDPYRYGSPPAEVADYLRFLTTLVGRYGPHGSFWDTLPASARHPIRRWQIWNEPMIPKYWTRQPWQWVYRDFLRLSRSTLHAADPGAQAVSAGLPNLGPGRSAWHWAQQLYANGGKGAFDALAVHPFASSPRNVLRTVQRVRAVMRRYGDAKTPIIVTETAYSSRASARHRSAPLGNLDTTLAGQATRTEQTLAALAAARRALGLEGVFYATWSSTEADSGSWPDWIGLNRVSGTTVTPKPALRAFRREAQRLRAGR